MDQLHFAVDDIAEEAGSSGRVGVIDTVVNIGNHDAAFQQDGHGTEQLGREVREGEVARVGHHADIE